MFCISLDYKNAECSSRSAFYLTKKQVISLKNEIDGALVALFTCNRGELYFECKPSVVLGELKKFGIVDGEIYKNIVLYSEKEVIYHIFEVTCGIHSMILGEDDVARQVKNAYYFSAENNLTTTVFNIVFQRAFSVSKRVKTETALSKSSTSFSTLAAKFAKEYIDGNNLKGNVLLVGATGDVGGIIAKNIVSYGYNLTVTSRHCNGEKISENNTVDYKDRYNYLNTADVIISATSSPHLIFDYDRCQNEINFNQLFIDLSIPNDIDKRIAMKSNLINVDYFEKKAKENNRVKLKSVEKALAIINEEANGCILELRQRGVNL